MCLCLHSVKCKLAEGSVFSVWDVGGVNRLQYIPPVGIDMPIACSMVEAPREPLDARYVLPRRACVTPSGEEIQSDTNICYQVPIVSRVPFPRHGRRRR